ncbi:MAG: SPOR domain-containing protein [Magnetococcales bacterium]|nr:SPOR domain-containing protein [Magnetococcales bacterium]
MVSAIVMIAGLLPGSAFSTEEPSERLHLVATRVSGSNGSLQAQVQSQAVMRKIQEAFTAAGYPVRTANASDATTPPAYLVKSRFHPPPDGFFTIELRNPEARTPLWAIGLPIGRADTIAENVDHALMQLMGFLGSERVSVTLASGFPATETVIAPLPSPAVAVNEPPQPPPTVKEMAQPASTTMDSPPPPMRKGPRERAQTRETGEPKRADGFFSYKPPVPADSVRDFLEPSTSSRPSPTARSDRDEDDSFPYTVQVGGYINRSSAISHVKQLRKRGYEPFIQMHVDGNGRPWNFVMVGRHTQRNDAQRAVLTFRQKEGGSAFATHLDPRAQTAINAPEPDSQPAAMQTARLDVPEKEQEAPATYPDVSHLMHPLDHPTAPTDTISSGDDALETPPDYTLQAGGYRNTAIAETHAARLRAKGLAAYLNGEKNSQGTLWTFLYIGRFQGLSRAKAFQETLQQQEGIKTFITKPPIDQEAFSQLPENSGTLQPRPVIAPHPAE